MWEASGVGAGPPVFPDIMTLGGPAPTPDASQSPKSICLSPNHPPLFGPFLDGGTQIQFHRHDDSFILPPVYHNFKNVSSCLGTLGGPPLFGPFLVQCCEGREGGEGREDSSQPQCSHSSVH